MSVYPTVYIDDAQGSRLLAPVNWSSLVYARQDLSVGALSLVLPAEDYDRAFFHKDGLIEVWNNPDSGSSALELEMLWMIRRVRYLDANQTWELTAYDLNHLLKRRTIDYNAENSYTAKLGAGDDIGKDIVSENLGTGATDTTRSIAGYLSIQAKIGAAPSVRINCSRQNVLTVLQEIAASAYQQGTYLTFDTIAKVSPGESTPNLGLEFRSYLGQRGLDRRGQIFLGPDFGNMTDVEIEEDTSEEITRAISTGQGVGSAQAVEREDDLTRWEGSPFGLFEGVRSAANALVAADLTADAQAFLKQGVGTKTISGKLLSVPGVEYGVDWNWGDLLGVQVRGANYTCRVSGIQVKYDAGGKQVEPTLVTVP